MPVTLSYDIKTDNNDYRNYVRSMFERFGWRRLGGSVFRYDGRKVSGALQEDWLNDVVPAIMFFRSYVLKNSIKIGFFTMDTMSVTRVEAGFGRRPRTGANLSLKNPTNPRSSVKAIKDFIDAAIAASP